MKNSVRARGNSYDAAMKIAPLIQIKPSQFGSFSKFAGNNDAPIFLWPVLHPIPKVITTLNRLLAGTKLRIAIIPPYYRSFVH